jgi:hypothetical protein
MATGVAYATISALKKRRSKNLVLKKGADRRSSSVE